MCEQVHLTTDLEDPLNPKILFALCRYIDLISTEEEDRLKQENSLPAAYATSVYGPIHTTDKNLDSYTLVTESGEDSFAGYYPLNPDTKFPLQVATSPSDHKPFTVRKFASMVLIFIRKIPPFFQLFTSDCQTLVTTLIETFTHTTVGRKNANSILTAWIERKFAKPRTFDYESDFTGYIDAAGVERLEADLSQAYQMYMEQAEPGFWERLLARETETSAKERILAYRRQVDKLAAISKILSVAERIERGEADYVVVETFGDRSKEANYHLTKARRRV